MKKEIFKANHEEKVIKIYQKDFEKLTPEEEKTIARYQNFGYEIKIIDNPQRKPRKGTATSKINEKYILAALGDDEAAKEKYNKIKSEQKFVGARNWFLNEYKTDK